MQKCLTDNVVTANEQGCPELEEQSAEANSHWEFTDVGTEPAEPRLRSGDSSWVQHLQQATPPWCRRAAAWPSIPRSNFAHEMKNFSLLAKCLRLSHRASPAHGQSAGQPVLMDPVPPGLVLTAASPTAAELLSSRFLSLLSTNLSCAMGMFNSSVLWLWLYSALEGNYCDLENCNSYAGPDMWLSNKALLIIVINGAVSKVLPITQHMSLSAHGHKHQENSFQLNLSLLPRTAIILISWYCR